jgi:plasmid stabilization system protein ParE
MTYRAPLSEYQFLFDHVVGLDRVSATARFSEATADVTAAVLTEAGRMCEEVMAPLQRVGDPKAIVRLLRAAGSRLRQVPNMAAWGCRWR